MTRAPKSKDAEATSADEPAAPDEAPSDAQLAADGANHNAESFARTQEAHAADVTVRSGGPNPSFGTRSFPEAASREDQETNAREAARAAAVNMTGNTDGVASVLPPAGGTTNMALTPTELQAQLDDGAVDARGRLVGTYLDDMQSTEAQRRREQVEGRATLEGDDADLRRAAAERVRNLARSEPISGADLGRAPDEQALVNTRKLTGANQDDANDPQRRAGATAGRDRSAGTDNT